MISADISAVIKELMDYKLEVQRRLENVVAGFAYEFILTLGNNTPVGDEHSIMFNHSYRAYYKIRQETYGIPMEAGYHSSQWKISTSGHIQGDTQITSPSEAANFAHNEMQQMYTLGSTFYIGHNTPGMEFLDDGYSRKAPRGITNNSLSQVMSAYQIDVVKYYNGLTSR
jgi:hypothetical protein